MPPVSRILVLRTKGEFEQGSYIIEALAAEWRRLGFRVDVTHGLTEPMGPDVLVIPHFDLTRTPPGQVALLERSARVINRSVTDISKRVISRQLVASPEDHEGPVIVKTNLNCGGWPEAKAATRQGEAARCRLRALLQQPWTISGVMSSDRYRIYDHPRLVPAAVWDNPRLVVEQFRPEREGENYCVRQYVFLGPCEFATRAVASDPLVKAKNVIRREVLDSTPEAVRAFRAQLGFDYGKFDYVMDGDEAVIFDVNRTPSYDPASKAGSAGSLILSLAAGIEPFLEAA